MGRELHVPPSSTLSHLCRVRRRDAVVAHCADGANCSSITPLQYGGRKTCTVRRLSAWLQLRQSTLLPRALGTNLPVSIIAAVARGTARVCLHRGFPQPLYRGACSLKARRPKAWHVPPRHVTMGDFKVLPVARGAACVSLSGGAHLDEAGRAQDAGALRLRVRVAARIAIRAGRRSGSRSVFSGLQCKPLVWDSDAVAR